MAADLGWLESHPFWLTVTVAAPLSLNLPLVLMVLSPLGITRNKFTELEVFDWNHWEHTWLALQSNWNSSLRGEDWSPQVPFGPCGPESSIHEAGSSGSWPQTEHQRPSPLCPGELYSASLLDSTNSPGGSPLLPPEQLWAATVSPVFEAPFLAGRLLFMRFPSLWLSGLATFNSLTYFWASKIHFE